MKKKLLIFLFSAKTSPFLLSKFEIEKFDQLDIEVKVHEMINIVNPALKKSYANSINSKHAKSFKSLSEWKKELLELLKLYKKENILIMNSIKISDLNTLRINYFIKKLRIRTIEFTNLNVPFFDHELNNPLRTIRRLFSIKIKKVILIKIFLFLKNNIFYFLKKILRFYPNYFLVFGNKSIDEFNKIYKKNRKSKLLLGNSIDYNLYLSHKKTHFVNDIKSDYALFLESPTPFFLGDISLIGEELIMQDALKWEISFDNFCNFIEKKYNLKVFIANHPRVKHESQNPKYYRGRTVLKSPLYHTSKDAKLLINKGSTAIAYGIIYKIPIMFITSSDTIIKRPTQLAHYKFLASHLDKTIINIDDNLENKIGDDIFKINYEKYNEYRKNFITARNDGILNSDIIKEIL